MLGGFAAALTEPGAWFIAIGLGMLTGGLALRTQLNDRLAIGLGLAVATALILWFEVEVRTR